MGIFLSIIRPMSFYSELERRAVDFLVSFRSASRMAPVWFNDVSHTGGLTVDVFRIFQLRLVTVCFLNWGGGGVLLIFPALDIPALGYLPAPDVQSSVFFITMFSEREPPPHPRRLPTGNQQTRTPVSALHDSCWFTFCYSFFHT